MVLPVEILMGLISAYVREGMKERIALSTLMIVLPVSKLIFKKYVIIYNLLVFDINFNTISF